MKKSSVPVEIVVIAMWIAKNPVWYRQQAADGSAVVLMHQDYSVNLTTHLHLRLLINQLKREIKTNKIVTNTENKQCKVIKFIKLNKHFF